MNVARQALLIPLFVLLSLLTLPDAVASLSHNDHSHIYELIKKAEQGDIFCLYHLGLIYAIGGIVRRDYREAAVWFRKAADQGHVLAQYNLGYMYR